MKKKLTAVLLTLCMVLGMLPLSALAAQYTGTVDGKNITFNVDDTTGAVSVDGTDSNLFYGFVNVTPGAEVDTITYYTDAGKTQTATVNVTKVTEEEETVTISFDLNGATGTAPEAQKIAKGTALTTVPTNPTRDGYTFKGWATAADGNVIVNLATQTFDADTTLYAVWEEQVAQISITFNVNTDNLSLAAEKVPTAPAAVTIDAGASLGNKLPTMEDITVDESTSYKFLGWAKTAEGPEDTSMASVTFSADATLYAQWEKVTVLSAPAEVNGETATAEVTEVTTVDEDAVKITVAPEGDTDTSAVKNETVSIPVQTAEALSGKEVTIAAITGTVVLDAETTTAIATTAEQASAPAVLKIDVSENAVAAPPAYVKTPAEMNAAISTSTDAATKAVEVAEGAAITTISVSLTVNNTPVFTTDKPSSAPITVSVNVEMTIGTGNQPAVFYVGGAAPVYHPAKYLNKVLSWTTNHFSDWAYTQIKEQAEEPTTPEELNVTQAAANGWTTYSATPASGNTLVWQVWEAGSTAASRTAKIMLVGNNPVSIKTGEKISIWEVKGTYDPAASDAADVSTLSVVKLYDELKPEA